MYGQKRETNTHIFPLEVLENAAECPLGGTESSVECMDIGLLQVGGLLGTEANVERPRLVVSAVGARHELLVLLLEGEPRFQIVLLSRSIVQRTGNDGHDLVREPQGLVELLGGGHHILESLPRLVGLGQDELLDLYDVRP
jgi:hypothetical protein